MSEATATPTAVRYAITAEGKKNLPGIVQMIGMPELIDMVGMSALIKDFGLEVIAEFLPLATEEKIAEIDAFSERVRAMTDSEIGSQWGVTTPDVISQIRELFSPSHS